MQRMLCVFLCLALFGCGKPSQKEEVITADDLIGLEGRLSGRIDEEVEELFRGIGQCQVSLEEKINGVRTEFETHRNEVNAVLKPRGQEPITAELLQRVKRQFREQDEQEIAARNGRGASREVAYTPQGPVPSPPRDDDVPRPREDPGRYVVTPIAQGCVAIQDGQTGWHYQWRQDQSGWRLVLWQQSHCARCGCVHPQWVYTSPPPGFPTP